MPKHGWVEKNHVNAVVKALVSWLPVRHGSCELALYPVSYSRSDYLIVSRCPNKIRILALAIFCLMPMDARIVIDSTD